MTHPDSRAERGAKGLKARVGRRAKRLLGPTLGVFGLDTDGHLTSPQVNAGKGVEARVREADEKDDRARLAIAEAEIATDRSEKQQSTPRPAPPKG
jgi:hypothetical protein